MTEIKDWRQSSRSEILEKVTTAVDSAKGEEEVAYRPRYSFRAPV